MYIFYICKTIREYNKVQPSKKCIFFYLFLGIFYPCIFNYIHMVIKELNDNVEN